MQLYETLDYPERVAVFGLYHARLTAAEVNECEDELRPLPEVAAHVAARAAIDSAVHHGILDELDERAAALLKVESALRARIKEVVARVIAKRVIEEVKRG